MKINFSRAIVPSYNNQIYESALFEKIYNPSFKGAVHVNNKNYADLAIKSKSGFINRCLKQPFMTEACGMEIQRNHRMFDVLDEKIQQLFVGGIIDHYTDVSRNQMSSNNSEKLQELTKENIAETHEISQSKVPKVMTLEQLRVAFALWLLLLIAATVVFAMEWVIKFKNCLIISFIFLSFYKPGVNKRFARTPRGVNVENEKKCFN